MNNAARAGWIIALLLALALVAGVIYVRGHRAETPVPAMALPSAASVAPVLPIAERHPIDEAVAASGTVELPPELSGTDDSDAGVHAALSMLAGGDDLDHLLVARDYLLQRIVAAIDALPRRQLPASVLPVRAAPGVLLTRTSDGVVTIDERNSLRYAPYLRVLEAVDARQLVAWYARHYGAFQQAYREQGNETGYFNDRLVEVIDHLLATPEPATPPRLQRPNVRYEFVDPGYESLSAGQKMLIRAGSDDAAKIKAKLRAIRAALGDTTLPDAAQSATSG